MSCFGGKRMWIILKKNDKNLKYYYCFNGKKANWDMKCVQYKNVPGMFKIVLGTLERESWWKMFSLFHDVVHNMYMYAGIKYSRMILLMSGMIFASRHFYYWLVVDDERGKETFLKTTLWRKREDDEKECYRALSKLWHVAECDMNMMRWR